MDVIRRPMGALESAVLDQIWRAPSGLTPREVLDGLGNGLAYTTITTILNRLWKKGLLERSKDGRAFRYQPLRSESEVIAGRMVAALHVAGDRRASLARFVEDLDPADEEALRSLMGRAL